ncbi:HTTM domain-containing protein [Euzebya tangerina]|uniref:HTTM domain-containing protein n=1 Tax=Euzebya tangerina TaxID=591198 RepID=UPI0013C2D480|nr:HTTM domain-containing protein [Euzebya tangerina]
MITRTRRRLTTPVDGASLAVLRIVFGLVVVWETYRYFSYDWIGNFWVDRAYTFTYPGFGWVAPLPGDAMYVVWAAIGLTGLCIALGVFYRVATVVFTLLFAYSFLLDHTLYLNHFYLMVLVGGILAVVPAHRVWSVDARLAARPETTVPTWALWLLRFQIAVMYVGGGIAKLSSDWLAGRPLDSWLMAGENWPLIGEWLVRPEAALVLSWSGLLLDLLVVPLVLWRPTRAPALIAVGAFHLINARLFSIGVFPVLAMGATLVLLPPDWPRRALARVRTAFGRDEVSRSAGTVTSEPSPSGGEPRRQAPTPRALLSVPALLLLVVFVAAQTLVPLRHLAIPGDPNWTEEGHDFAWHMKLRSKSGHVDFVVSDRETGEIWVPDLEQELASWQISRMAARPRLILQYAGELGRQATEVRGFADPEVVAHSAVSLNGRPHAPLVSSRVDLLTVDDVSMIIEPHPDERPAPEDEARGG